ncbi:hypothetical protein [Pseudomonas fluorescens]|uniref:hypothetical protein n=1 Tax=Pseudomonas fluorescens TaxID=294 RepID=UPI0012404264|nr:hypothetical protein [Pseudomonas fluorescens]
MQQPTCELVRDGQRTYLQLRLPGVRTREMDSRQLHLRAFHQRWGNVLEVRPCPGRRSDDGRQR